MPFLMSNSIEAWPLYLLLYRA